MHIIIKSEKIKFKKEWQDFLEERVRSLEKIWGKEILEARIDIKKNSKHQKGPVFVVACEIKLPGIIVRAEKLKENLKSAILAVEKKLERKLKEFKRKSKATFKRGARRVKRELLISEGAKTREGKRKLREGL